MKFSNAVVKRRILILILAAVLMIPSVFGMAATRINYDMLNYLPEDMETVKGQNILTEEFGKGAFSFIVAENMPDKDISALREKIAAVEHVDTVLWYDSLMDISVPKELLPQKIYSAFNTENATMLAVFFDTSTSSDETIEAIHEIRDITGKQCFVSGMSALVTDLKDLCEQEEPIYILIAVLLACAAMMLFLDNWLVPFVFLLSIGVSILFNMGTNFFLGEISYITKALSAVLQLAVTMDYSIFLWHSYNECKQKAPDNNSAMAEAISNTLTSVTGSSVTTIAGFIALCFMSFTLGRDLGIVMAKGVLLGVIGCVTVLPSLILVLDKPLNKLHHKPLIHDMKKLSAGVVKIFPVFIAVFVIAAVPAFIGYKETNSEVYYDLGECLPDTIEYVTANEKLQGNFDIASTHMALVSSGLSSKDTKQMISEIESTEGVKYALGLESVVGSRIPGEFIPDEIKGTLQSGNYKLLLINSEYKPASDEVNNQIDELTGILKKYDGSSMLIGEASCTKDMIETTDRDFRIVNAISIAAIFVIIALVEKSITLPIILVALIELSIFINLGLPHYLGQSLPFIAPICISTIQLGATFDYAILMTTRYKTERSSGKDKREAVITALSTSIPSVIVSAMGLFAATFGVALYSDIDIISSMCMLMARGAVISMVCVMFILPALFMLCDKLIGATTIGFKNKDNKKNKHNNADGGILV